MDIYTKIVVLSQHNASKQGHREAARCITRLLKVVKTEKCTNNSTDRMDFARASRKEEVKPAARYGHSPAREARSSAGQAESGAPSATALCLHIRPAHSRAKVAEAPARY